MPLSFPNSPSVNDTYTVGQRTWTWTGSIWELSADTIGAASVTSNELASNAVTTAKIASEAVTTAKIASDAVTTAKILDSNVTTAKIAANAVTQAKLASNLSAVTVTTTANRDTDIPSPFTGQLAILTDTKKVQLYDGTSWLNITMAPPEPPTSLSATALSTTSVSVAFTAGAANGSAITNYKYALSTDNGSTYGSYVALDPVDITSPITISSLTAGTTYYIKLKAVNDLGDSVASSAASVTTLSTPDAPTSLSASNITASTVDISFTAGAQGGSAISNYQYALSTNGGSSYGAFTALNPADATSPITITGLTDGTAYYVKLKAVNNDGAGAESSAVSFSTLFAINYLVVAGGGSGGAYNGAPNHYDSGGNGSNSVFNNITSTGGGGGGANDGQGGVGISGGSGGGAGYGAAGLPHAGGAAASPTQGFKGGDSANHSGAGGGGAGAAGANSTSATTVGGDGLNLSITGTYTYYAGGGGAGGAGGNGRAGGLGGGGAGGSSGAAGTAGTANTGGGGGAGDNNQGATHGGGGAGGLRCSYQQTGGLGALENPLIPTLGTNYTVTIGGGAASTGYNGAGGSGVVILRYSNIRTITIGAGLTGSTATDGNYKVTTLTSGSGNVSWA